MIELITAPDRRRLEAVIERLGDHHERFARHARRAAAALARIERLRQSAIHALDYIDGDPDLEDSDEDDQCDDEGAIEVDDDRENEASLCGIGFGAPQAVIIHRREGREVLYDLEVEDGQ